MMKWEELDDQMQIYLYWEFRITNPEIKISFTDFDKIMTGIIQLIP